MEGAVGISKKLKDLNPNMKILFVGGHVAALPYETLEKEYSIDIVACNEGVYSILNLLELQNLKTENLKKIKGIF